MKLTKQQKYITTGNDKADAFAKLAADQDGAEEAELLANEVKENRQRIHAAIQYAACFHVSVEEFFFYEKNGEIKFEAEVHEQTLQFVVESSEERQIHNGKTCQRSKKYTIASGAIKKHRRTSTRLLCRMQVKVKQRSQFTIYKGQMTRTEESSYGFENAQCLQQHKMGRRSSSRCVEQDKRTETHL